jgi:transposase-like protein
MRFHTYGDPDDVYCPMCKSADIRFFTFTNRGEEYTCKKCGLSFRVVKAAVWENVFTGCPGVWKDFSKHRT